MSARLEISNPDLDKAEREWWELFSDVEERFCWVQSLPVRRFLGSYYLPRIKRVLSNKKRIVEFGCGSGWLSILLAQMGIGNIVGIDLSGAQIEAARRNAIENRVSDKVIFKRADILDSNEIDEYDSVIIHTVLHHFSIAEIRQVIKKAHEILVKSGILIVIEPILYASSCISMEKRFFLKSLSELRRLLYRPMCGLRKFSPKEHKTREFIDQRYIGKLPFGPSPKEIPFTPQELPDLLKPYFSLQRRTKCLALSREVAKELLLLGLSYPQLTRIIKWPFLWLARYLDRTIVKVNPPEVWIFEMFEFSPNK